jgi:ribosomal protein RSM22 (predicted rRNA methylase)
MPHTVLPTEICIADVGAGPLTMTFGLLFHLLPLLKKNPPSHQMPITVFVDAYELNLTIVKEGMALLKDYLALCGLKNQVRVIVTPRAVNLLKDRLPVMSYDYVLAGNLFNEFETRDVQWQLCQKILSLCKKQGRVLFLEPSFKKVSRDLQALRDQVMGGTFQILGPCLHHETCPLNVVAKADWCHFRHEWQAPKFIQAFDQLTHLKKTHLLYSYLFLKNSAEPKPIHQFTEFVAISDIMTVKNHFEWMGCGPAGRVRFLLQRNEWSSLNQDFQNIGRGQRFVMPDYRNTKGYRLDEIVTVKKSDVIKIL